MPCPKPTKQKDAYHTYQGEKNSLHLGVCSSLGPCHHCEYVPSLHPTLPFLCALFNPMLPSLRCGCWRQIPNVCLLQSEEHRARRGRCKTWHPRRPCVGAQRRVSWRGACPAGKGEHERGAGVGAAVHGVDGEVSQTVVSSGLLVALKGPPTILFTI